VIVACVCGGFPVTACYVAHMFRLRRRAKRSSSVPAETPVEAVASTAAEVPVDAPVEAPAAPVDASAEQDHEVVEQQPVEQQPAASKSTVPFEQIAADVQSILAQIPIDFGGGCSVDKALSMVRLLLSTDAELAVDVGVYRGRSFFPLAVAFRALGHGQAIGVDPYTVGDAMQLDKHEVGAVLTQWTAAQDWGALHDQVVGMLEREGLSDYGRILRKRSEDAVPTFEPHSMDLVHIDGNHDRAAVELDLAMYRPLVKIGGYIVLDDISWASVGTVYDELKNTAVLIEERRSNADDYAIFHLVNG